MPARFPRRSFAAPFVLTVAAACGGHKPEPVHPNPPGPTDPTPEVNRWTVYKQGDKCFAVDANACPPADGPAPIGCAAKTLDYPCPDGMSLETPVVVVRVDATSCEEEQSMGDCPEGASCNPPPPQPMACPAE